MLLCAGLAQAEAGKVINLSGPLFSVAGDGSRRVLSVGSSIEPGDTLMTEEKTYARVKFTDNSEIVLRPKTQMKIESYAFTQTEPTNDGVVFNLVKGALRAVSGLIGKRGNQDAYKLQTKTATIGIRGTTFIAEFVPFDPADAAKEAVASADEAPPAFALLWEPLPLFAQADTATDALLGSWSHNSRQPLLLALNTTVLTDAATDVLPVYLSHNAGQPLLLAQNSPTPGAGGLAAGLYVHVIDGIINLTNKGGSQSFSAGQFGYTASIIKPPVIVPANPGIRFSPPPAFSSSTAPRGGTTTNSDKPQAVDCEVR
jgi:hypothetical protein